MPRTCSGFWAPRGAARLNTYAFFVVRGAGKEGNDAGIDNCLAIVSTGKIPHDFNFEIWNPSLNIRMSSRKRFDKQFNKPAGGI